MNKELMDYFIAKTDERFKLIETKLDTIIKFKYQVIGGSVLVSIILTASFQLLLHWTNK